MFLDLPKLLRRDRPQVHSLFGDILNVQHNTDRETRVSAFGAMAVDLDNCSSSGSSSSSTVEGGVQDSYTSWTAEVSSSPEFSRFCFPSPSKVKWRAVEDVDTCTLFSEGESSSPPKATYLFSQEEVYKQSHIPPLVIGIHDIVGERQLVPKKDGFMYYDTTIAPLHRVICTRGLFVSCEDPMLDLDICLKNHAVRIFQEVHPVAAIVNGPFYRYIGDYYIIRTRQTLPKMAWAQVSEEVKAILVRRYIESVVTPAEDPIPGNRYSADNVRKWYDHGNVLPLVALRQTFRSVRRKKTSDSSSSSLVVQELTFGSAVSSSDEVDPRSESVYSEESTDENAHYVATQDDHDCLSVSGCSDDSAYGTYNISSGVFIPSEGEDIGTWRRPAFSLCARTEEVDSCEEVGCADAMQLLEVETDGGTLPLTIPFLLQECRDEGLYNALLPLDI